MAKLLMSQPCLLPVAHPPCLHFMYSICTYAYLCNFIPAFLFGPQFGSKVTIVTLWSMAMAGANLHYGPTTTTCGMSN